MNVVIWGVGKNCKIVLETIRKDKCNIIGIVDSKKEYHKTFFLNKWAIDAPDVLINNKIDYIIISSRTSEDILKQCECLGITKDRIIDYWKSDQEYDFIDTNVKKIFILESELEKCKRQLKNMPYELGLRPTPVVRSAEELLWIIIEKKKSLSRFGDGELEIMQKRERPWFQKSDDRLAGRLKEIFNSHDEKIIIALADDFGNLDGYTDQAADGIRKYLEHGIREDLMRVIDVDRIYYNAYVTRPYLIYKDKKYAMHIFELFKKVWKNRDVLLVEGEKAFIGVRNDLFEGAARVRRILAPSKNAFSLYDQIFELAKKNVLKDTLVLISLGPTATVLAYDLAIEGIQALDIG